MSELNASSVTRNSLSLATACAVMMAATCVTASAAAPSQLQRTTTQSRVADFDSDNEDKQSEVIRRIDAYCRASWKNARIDESYWDDCTQDVYARVFGSLTRDQLYVAISDRESPERRELNRAIWATSQRRRREVRWQELSEFHDSLRAPTDEWRATEADLQTIRRVSGNSQLKLSPTQQAIIHSSTEGQSVQEIAQRLNLSPVRVSDEKYKATQKLRKHFANS